MEGPQRSSNPAEAVRAQLEQSINRIDDALNELDQRLALVLIPAPAADMPNTKDSSDGSAGSSPLTAWAGSLCLRAENIAKRINCLRERVEL